jgi:hypothetical protein
MPLRQFFLLSVLACDLGIYYGASSWASREKSSALVIVTALVTSLSGQLGLVTNQLNSIGTIIDLSYAESRCPANWSSLQNNLKVYIRDQSGSSIPASFLVKPWSSSELELGAASNAAAASFRYPPYFTIILG